MISDILLQVFLVCAIFVVIQAIYTNTNESVSVPLSTKSVSVPLSTKSVSVPLSAKSVSVPLLGKSVNVPLIDTSSMLVSGKKLLNSIISKPMSLLPSLNSTTDETLMPVAMDPEILDLSLLKKTYKKNLNSNLDDDFLYDNDENIPFAESRSNENLDVFPLNDDNDEKTIAEVHDEFLMRSVNRENDNTKVDGYYGDEMYDIDNKPSDIGYTDFATY